MMLLSLDVSSQWRDELEGAIVKKQQPSLSTSTLESVCCAGFASRFISSSPEQ